MVNVQIVEQKFPGSGMIKKVFEKSKALPATTILIGFGGMIGQLLLIRVLMVIFYGNELSLSLVIANWLLMEGLGSYLGGKLSSCKSINSRSVFLGLFIIYPFSLIAAIIMARLIGGGFLVRRIPGLAMNLSQMLITALITIGMTSIVHGSLFPLAAELFEREKKELAVSRAYLTEIIGTILGGLFFVFIFAQRLKALEITTIILILHLIILIWLINNYKLFSYRYVLNISLIIVTGVIIIFFNPISNNLHEYSLRGLWPEGEVVDYRNSIYGNIVTLSREGEKTLLYDGSPMLSLTNPDISWSEDYAYLVAAAHEKPENLLMIGQGIGGPISFLLEHSIEELTYTELDPGLLDIMRDGDSDIIQGEFDDPRVNIIEQDGRLYLNRTENRYDIIKIGDIDTETLQMNRFYTEEIFELAEKRLKDNGIIAFSLPGSYTYMGGELALLNSSLYRTVDNVFENTYLIPGDRNIILASNDSLSIEAEVYVERLRNRGLYGRRFTTGYLEYRLDQSRIDNLTESLIATEARLNRDFNPGGFYYGMLNRARVIAPEYLNIFYNIGDFGIRGLIIVGIFILFICWLLFKRANNSDANRLTYLIVTTGGIAMSFDILIMFALQSLFGHIYQFSGLFIVAFMGGMFGGGRLAYKFIESKNGEEVPLKDYLKRLELGIVGLLLLFIVVIYILRNILLIGGSIYISAIICVILALMAGGVTGAEFPLATEFLPDLKSSETAGSTAGRLYTADLLGGWAAGLIIGIFVFPMTGLVITISGLIVIKVSSYLLIYGVLAD